MEYCDVDFSKIKLQELCERLKILETKIQALREEFDIMEEETYQIRNVIERRLKFFDMKKKLYEIDGEEIDGEELTLKEICEIYEIYTRLMEKN